MADDFDPYFKWLSIPPDQQPPNHYRLLGVPEFVDDADVIENAADKQTMMLRTLATGKHAAISQRILNEVSTAKLTLLDPAQKSAYDTQLRQARAPRGPGPPRTRAAQPATRPTPPRAVPASPPVSINTSPAPGKKTSRQQSKAPLVVGGVVLTLLLAVGLFFALSSSSEDPPEVAIENSDTVKLPKPNALTQPTPKPRPKPEPEIRPQPKPETKQVPKPQPKVEQSEKSPSSAKQKNDAVDLLETVDLEKNSMLGEWSMENGNLISDFGHNVIQLDHSVQEAEYNVTIDYKRNAPNRHYISMGLVSPLGKHFSAVIASDGSGLHILDGKHYHQSASSSGKSLPPDDDIHRLELLVRQDGVSLVLDGTRQWGWLGDYKRLTPDPRFAKIPSGALFLGASNVTVERFEFQPISDDNPGESTDPNHPQQTVNLLGKIDLERNTLRGKWSLDQGVLHGEANGSIVQIDHLVSAAEYDVVVDVQNTDTTCYLTLGLVSPLQRQFSLAMGHHNTGLGTYDGRPFHANETTIGRTLPHDRMPHTLIYQVRKEGVTLLLDNEPHLQWRGDYSKLTRPQGVEISSDQIFYLSSQGVSIKRLEYRPLGVEPKPADPDVIDLLSTLDLDKNPVGRNWKLDGGVLQGTKDTEQFQFDCPMQFAEYDVTMVVKNTDRNYRANMGLVSPRGQQFTVFVEGPSGSSVGAVDGRTHGPNSSHSKRLLPDDGEFHTLVFQVRKQGVDVLLDGEYLLQWHEDIRRLSRPSRYRKLDSQGLFLDALNIVVKSLRYRPLTDSGPMIEVPQILSTGPRMTNQYEGHPVPTREQQQDSLKKIQEVFQEEFGKARTDELRSELARKLHNQSREIRDDLPTRYALLLESLRLATQAGDSMTAISVATSLEHAFHIPSNSIKVETLKTLSKTVRSDRQRQYIGVRCLELINQSLYSGKPHGIDSLLEIAYSSARAVRDDNLLKNINAKKLYLAEVGKASLLAEKAMKTLESQPDHPQANLNAGRFLCFIKGDWPLGLMMLSKGSDRRLKALAEAELANPQEGNGNVELGDAWKDYSTSLQGLMKKNARERAATHYQHAKTRLKGLDRAKVEMKLQSLNEN